MVSQVREAIAALVLFRSRVLSGASVAAAADGIDLTPGPTGVADENSPTGHTRSRDAFRLPTLRNGDDVVAGAARMG